MSLELRQLRHVIALARHGNFARAAESLSITQPALSRSIQSIERSLGAQLFDRSSTGAVPTAIGQRLVDNGEDILRRALDTERELMLMLGLELGELRVGAGAYPAEISIGSTASRFIQAHPRVRLEVTVGDFAHLTPRLLASEIDVAVGNLSHVRSDERFAIEALPSHQGYFFVRTGHPLTTLAKLTLSDLHAYPMAGTALPAEIGAELGVPDGTMGHTQPDGTFIPQARVDTFRLARQIVLQTDAVGFAVTSQLVEDEHLGRIRVLPLTFSWFRSNFGIIRLAGRTPSPAESAFCTLLREVEAEVVAAEAATRAAAGRAT
jgi:DNA-binding transcriptional LysR family regulator